MKKFLSLVLALAMAMSLVTVGAGAKDFTDSSKINYDKAVAVLSAAGVIDGYEDGSFNPDTVLNRGQAAKIICNLILGPTTASALRADAAPYKDVPADHHFAGYIAYCAQQGIISGYSDGTFRPTGTLTGYAFMKMLLGALGYDAQIEGYVGPNWSIAVAKRALSDDVDLADGNDEFVGQKAVTREEACLYAFNTLEADMVDYDSKTTVEINGATVNVGNSKAYKVERTSGKDYTGASESSDKYDSCGTQQFCEKYFTKLTADKEQRDDFGRPATKWFYDGDKIGKYADDPDTVCVIPDANKDLEMLMTDGDYLDYDAEDINGGAKVYYNGQALTDEAKNSTYDNLKAKSDIAGKGDIIEVFEDDMNNADTIVVRSYTYAKIDKVDDELSKTLQNKKATVGLDLVDIDGNDLGNGTYYDDHDDDEKVLNGFSADTYTEDTVLAVAMGADDAILDSYVVKCITGEPTAARAVELYSYVGGESSKGVKNGTITVDGTKYTYAAQFTGLDENAKVDFDKEYVVYLTAEGYALAVDGDAAASLSDVYYVVGVYKESRGGTENYYAQAISLEDGTVEDMKLDDDHEGNATDTLRSQAGTSIVRVDGFYKFDSDGSSYDVDKYTDSNKYDVVEKATLTNDVTNSSSVVRYQKDNVKANKYLKDDTLFIGAEKQGEDLDVTMSTGKMTQDASNTTPVYVSVIFDDDDAVFVVYAGQDLNGAADKSDLLYMTDNAHTRPSKDTYLVDLFSLKDMELMTDIEIDDDEHTQGFYIYDVDSDGIYDLDKPKTSSKLDYNSDGEVDDDSDGYAEGVKFTSGKNQPASDATNSFVAVDFSDATIIDTRGSSDKKADAYSNDITTASRLTSALNKGWVVCDVYVEDGDIVFIAVVECMDDGETNPYSFKAVETGTANIIL